MGQSADGTFELRGIPPGRVRVRVRAEGHLEPAAQEIALQPAQQSDVLVFAVSTGLAVPRNPASKGPAMLCRAAA